MKTKQYLIIGAGRFGSALATTLYQYGHEVVVADIDEGRIEAIMDKVTHALILDSTDEASLATLGVRNFDQVIVAIAGNLEASILGVVHAKALGARSIVCKATSEVHRTILKKVGADIVVRPEHDMGVRLAKQLATPNMVDAFDLGDAYEVVEITAKDVLVGKLSELKLSNRFGVQIIAVNQGSKLVITPPADFTIQPGDDVVIIGDNLSLKKLRDHLTRVST